MKLSGLFSKKIQDVKVFSLWPTYWLYPVSHYPDEENFSDGEVERMTFRDANKNPIGHCVIGCRSGYDFIWRHIGFGYYKVTSKTKELWGGQ